MDPSQTSFFQALNIGTKIVKGQIELALGTRRQEEKGRPKWRPGTGACLKPPLPWTPPGANPKATYCGCSKSEAHP